MAGVKTLQAAIEAILFTMGESVELSKIAKAIEQDEQTTEELLQDLMKNTNQRTEESVSLNWTSLIRCVQRRKCMTI